MVRETRTLTHYTDDIENKPFAEGEGGTLSFSYDGKSYEIDLNNKNAKKAREAFQFYVDHGRQVSGNADAAVRRTRGSGSTGRSSQRDYDLVDLRRWAAENAIDLSARGRINGEIIEQYKAARG